MTRRVTEGARPRNPLTKFDERERLSADLKKPGGRFFKVSITWENNSSNVWIKSQVIKEKGLYALQ